MPPGIAGLWLRRKLPGGLHRRSAMVLAMKRGFFAWLSRRPTTWAYLQQLPMRHLSVFMLAAFLLFTVVGFYDDLMNGGVQPFVILLGSALFSGLNAVLWVLVLARLPIYGVMALIAFEIFSPSFKKLLFLWVQNTFHPAPVASEFGIHFASTAILIAVVLSYVVFSSFMGLTGKEAFRVKNELELAQSIQKTLVPPIAKNIQGFDVFGISQPSEKVGGDLVDVVELKGGDTIAYIADIAGHGLQAGILMGMLKTAARTALADADSASQDGEALSMLMQRLNLVLPQVKESHMYATFTGMRLNADGQVFYGMAASPPLLYWSAERKSILRIEEEQFPLGILPVLNFPWSRLAMVAGDIVVIATDGILEVTSEMRSKRGVEFGCDALETLVANHAEEPLPALATIILDTVRKYGRQMDDQTLLLVRKNIA